MVSHLNIIKKDSLNESHQNIYEDIKEMSYAEASNDKEMKSSDKTNAIYKTTDA